MQYSTGWVSRLVNWFGGMAVELVKYFHHHLPLTLLLACVLAGMHIWRPPWFERTTSLAMEMVSTLELSLDSHGIQPSNLRQGLTEEGHDEKWGHQWTVVSLGPEAHKQFLLRATPTPRARLACVIESLAHRLKAIEGQMLDEGKQMKPVVVIDIDITTVERQSNTGSTALAKWQRQKDELECLTPGPDCLRIITTDDAMRCALRRLSERAYIVAAVYPRVDQESRLARNSFMRDTCFCDGPECPVRPKANDAVVRYGSAQLISAPPDVLYEFPSAKATPGAEPDDPGLPPMFPGLGLVIAATLENQKASRRADAVREEDALSPWPSYYCKLVHSKKPTDDAALTPDDIALGSAQDRAITSAYKYETVKFDLINSHIDTFQVYPQRFQNLSSDALSGFSGLPPSDVYVLSVDSGTTEDKFMIPVWPNWVSGAWTHAAIGASIWIGRAAEREEPVHQQYLHHFETELLFGAVLLLVVMPAGRWPDRETYPSINRAVLLVLPLTAAAAVLMGYLKLTIDEFGRGFWTNPTVMALGLAIHIYVDAAASGEGAASDQPAHRSRWDAAFEAGLQWAWAMIIAVSVYAGVTPTISAKDAPVILLSLAATTYVLIARQVEWMPLPARPSHH